MKAKLLCSKIYSVFGDKKKGEKRQCYQNNAFLTIKQLKFSKKEKEDDNSL